ncbi:MAG TPA: L-histidine N(alpha)-methyltransferase [Candidatus Angelobacter sp.]|jgi:dimethylhistidine N-methyltransferase|nr:L-histidine N(alpha)-methyltransferase [Candidatus Angelobacter sp.]
MTAIKSPAVLVSPIADEVLRGLTAHPRRLPPKLFYDAAGSHLFEQITETPEYYPTRTERGILKKYAGEIIRQAGNNLTLVELGAGSASKTQVLIEALLRRQLRADFYPVDVSSSALQDALATLNGHFPRLRVAPIVADYTHKIPDLNSLPGRKLVLFIGSTIGNFEPDEAMAFLKSVHRSLQPGDALLIGFDLIKDAGILHAAYNDAQCVTAAFNKNMLVRINRELGGSFDVDAFEHVALWNRRKSRIEMHLESVYEQTVWVQDLDRGFHFERGERIHTENSYKFNAASIVRLLRRSGFRLEKSWTDAEGWFCEALARV